MTEHESAKLAQNILGLAAAIIFFGNQVFYWLLQRLIELLDKKNMHSLAFFIKLL